MNLTGWRGKQPSKRATLRALFEAATDGRWFTQSELWDGLSSHRFGAVVHDVHDGRDGKPPIHYERWADPTDDSRVLYRPCPPERCTNCLERRVRATKKRALEVRIQILEAENRALRERLAELEAQ